VSSEYIPAFVPLQLDVDVCVVGAGYGGLTAARRLRQAGKTVAVLEARDRIGGRIWTDHLSDGSPVDRGGAWLAPNHEAIFRLAQEFGVSTYKTWVQGAHLLISEGRTRRYTGLIPKIREPFGLVHWAGTETSTTSHDAIDGAVRSGERAAGEILGRS
jgi:monoamine oxidase